MFTGIVQAVGRIAELQPKGDGVRMIVDAVGLPLDDVSIGDSVAVNGCCLTLVAIGNKELPCSVAFDVSAETLRCTAGLDAGSEVNLEKALRLSDRLGGHLLSGHVDATGTVVAFDQVSPNDHTDSGLGFGRVPASDSSIGSWRLEIEAPHALMRYIAAKGSIAVQGVSLTVNRVRDNRFEVNLIPHTIAVTTLHNLINGARVNLEVDMLARYVERLLQVPAGG